MLIVRFTQNARRASINKKKEKKRNPMTEDRSS